MKLGTMSKTVALSALLASTNTTAFNTDFLSVTTEGSVSYSTTPDSEWSDNSGVAVWGSMTVEARLTDSIKAVITAQIYEALMANGDWDSIDLSDNELKKMITEAYIEIKMVQGAPVAFIIGKQEIAFGQNFSGLSRWTNYEMTKVSQVKGVIGLTVKLDTNFFDLIDSVEASVFENGADDFEVGKINNASIRVSGDLMENVRASASYMNQEVAGDREQRTSVGVIYTNGNWTAHVEAIGMIDSQELSDTTFAINTGIAREVGNGKVAVEYAWIEDSLNLLQVSYLTKVSKNVKAGPFGTYDIDSGDVGVGLHVSFYKEVVVGKKDSTLLGN